MMGSGDFTAGGLQDIALLPGLGSGWTTIPVAYNTGNGAFRVTNEESRDFAGWAQTDPMS
ncbi:hypothetical protein [Actinoplanes sp. NPDC049265]|uniref:hypothetical protein n=1 Tax=Actinoplanes sp. NPDC049265 TaxID=3363902 RepID=UPI0037217F87